MRSKGDVTVQLYKNATFDFFLFDCHFSSFNSEFFLFMVTTCGKLVISHDLCGYYKMHDTSELENIQSTHF